MSKTDENGFVQAVLAAPDDDGLRLIYADWLDEHGDPARAEFIRLQLLQREVDPYSLLHEERQERINAILKQHRSRWVAHLPEWAYYAEFRRGFPAHVRLTLNAFLESADELAQLMPLESIEVKVENPADLARLVRHPALGRLRELKFDLMGKLNAESMQILASCPYLTRVNRLYLACQPIGNEGAAHLATADLPALRNLDLYATKFGSKGLEALSSAPFMRQLTELRLGPSPIGTGQLGFLTKTPALEVLELNELGLGDEDMETLASVPLTQLRELVLSKNAITGQGLAALAQSRHLTSLSKLELYKNPLGEGAGAALATATFRLAVLLMSEVKLGDEGLAPLAQSDRLSRLTELSLAENGLTEVSARLLAECEHLGQLRELRLCLNPLGSNGAIRLLSSPTMSSLLHLDLDETEIESFPSVVCPPAPAGMRLNCLRVANNHISGAVAQCLFCRPELAQLKKLFVFKNPLGAAGMKAIAHSPFLTTLDWLHASNTALGPAGAQALSASTTLRRLRNLILIDCGLGDGGMEALADSPVLDSVESLDLGRNSIREKGAKALAASPHLQRLRRLSIH